MSISDLEVQPLPLVRDAATGPQRIISVMWRSAAGGRATVSLTCGAARVSREVDAAPGANTVRLAVPEPDAETGVRAEVRNPAGDVAETAAPLAPVRPWRVFLVHHSHLDIGYTDVQPHILHLHLGFIDDALHFCERTGDWSEDSRFRWNFETSLPLATYCRQRGADARRRLGRCLREGQMEIGAFAVNLHAETCAFEEMVGSLRDAHLLARRFGVPLRSAMHSDVPGLPWTAVQLLAASGVRYLSLAPNNHRAPVHRRRGFDRPFWWRAPDGARVLTWFTDDPRHVYQEGNHLGFIDSYEAVLATLPARLADLERAGFPYDALHLRCQGAYADNGPPNLRISEVVARWNREWLWPRVRVARNSDFFTYMEERWGGQIPEHPGDWPDWWADGTGSAAREMGLVREAHAQAALAGSAAALAGNVPEGVPEDLAAADREMLLFDEHTWGAALPEEDTLRGFGSEGRQWSYKSAFAHRAQAHAASAAAGAVDCLAAQLRTGDLPAVFLFNGTGVRRSAPVCLELPRWLGAGEGSALRIHDPQSGREVPYEWIPAGIHDRPALRFVAPEVPALGYRRLDLELGGPGAAGDQRRQSGPAATQAQNAWFSLTLDVARGGISSLRALPSGRELVDPEGPYGLNTFISDRYSLADPFEVHGRLEARQAGAPIAPGPATRSPVDQTLTYRWEGADGADPVSCSVRLYDGLPGLYLENLVAKRAADHREGLYFAFPFALAGLHEIHHDLPGGTCALGREQLPGSRADWSVVAAGAWLKAPQASILWGTMDACLVQFDAIRTSVPAAGPERPGHIYSYVANNLWGTNFVPRQKGELRFRYVIAAPGEADAWGFGAFGQGVLQPLAATAVPARQGGRLAAPLGELLRVHGEGVLLESLRPDGEGGMVARLRECAGGETVAELAVEGLTGATLVTPTGDHLQRLPLGSGGVRVPLGPRGLAHVSCAMRVP